MPDSLIDPLFPPEQSGPSPAKLALHSNTVVSERVCRDFPVKWMKNLNMKNKENENKSDNILHNVVC